MTATPITEAGEYMEANEVEAQTCGTTRSTRTRSTRSSRATHNACVVNGKLDAKKVWDWQDNSGITADGCVDAKTVLARKTPQKAQQPAAAPTVQTQV